MLCFSIVIAMRGYHSGLRVSFTRLTFSWVLNTSWTHKDGARNMTRMESPCIQGSAFKVYRFTGFFSFPFIFRRRNNYLWANNLIKNSNGIAIFRRNEEGFEQPGLVKDAWQEGWTRWSLKAPSNTNHSVILRIIGNVECGQRVSRNYSFSTDKLLLLLLLSLSLFSLQLPNSHCSEILFADRQFYSHISSHKCVPSFLHKIFLYVASNNLCWFTLN